MKLTSSKPVIIGVAALLLITAVYFIANFYTSDSKPTKIQPTPKGKQFTIAVIAPLSGPLEAQGTSIAQGATLAAEGINKAGGVKGFDIRLLVLDSAGDPDRAYQLAQDAIAKGKANAIVGTLRFEESEPVAEVTAESKTPFIMVANGPLRTCNKDDPSIVEEHLWQLGMTEPMWVEPFLVHIADKHSRPTEQFLFSYFGTSEYRSRAEADFIIDSAESLGFGTVLEEYPDPRIRDHYETLNQFLRHRADVLFITINQQSLLAFMEQAHKMSVRRDLLIAGFNSFTEEKLRMIGSLSEGITTAFGYHPDVKNKENEAFLAAWRAKYQETEPTSLVVMSYSAIHLLADAVKKTGKTTPKALNTQLQFVDTKLPQGLVLGNKENHTFTQPLYAGTVEQGKLKLGQYLGDVSHPAMKRCDPLGAPPPTPPPTPESRY